MLGSRIVFFGEPQWFVCFFWFVRADYGPFNLISKRDDSESENREFRNEIIRFNASNPPCVFFKKQYFPRFVRVSRTSA